MVLPDTYHLNDVQKVSRLSSGGEATIYQGLYKGRVIVIREFYSPSNDSATRSVEKVSWCFEMGSCN